MTCKSLWLFHFFWNTMEELKFSLLNFQKVKVINSFKLNLLKLVYIFSHNLFHLYRKHTKLPMDTSQSLSAFLGSSWTCWIWLFWDTRKCGRIPSIWFCSPLQWQTFFWWLITFHLLFICISWNNRTPEKNR